MSRIDEFCINLYGPGHTDFKILKPFTDFKLLEILLVGKVKNTPMTEPGWTHYEGKNISIYTDNGEYGFGVIYVNNLSQNWIG